MKLEHFQARHVIYGSGIGYNGTILLNRRQSIEKHLEEADSQTQDSLLFLPSTRCLLFGTETGLRIGKEDLIHGESETRFVTCFKIT